MSKSLITRSLIIILLLIGLYDSIEAQRTRRTSSRQRTERTQEKDPDQGSRLGLSLGTLGFFNGWSISAKGSYGYQVNKFVQAGINSKFFFQSVNITGPNPTEFSYGLAAYARLFITDEIYAQGEYGRISLEQAFLNAPAERNDFTYPSVGGGYQRGFGNWSSGFHLLVPLDANVGDAINVEYWIDFNYKF